MNANRIKEDIGFFITSLIFMVYYTELQHVSL